RKNRAMKLGGGVVDYDWAARRLLLALVVSREVGADLLPRVAVVRSLEQYVTAEVDRLRIVRRSDDRRVPIEAILVAGNRVAARADFLRIRMNAACRSAVGVGDADVAALRV